MPVGFSLPVGQSVSRRQLIKALTAAGLLQEKVEQHCFTDLAQLLSRAKKAFPNAVILVSNYAQARNHRCLTADYLQTHGWHHV